MASDQSSPLGKGQKTFHGPSPQSPASHSQSSRDHTLADEKRPEHVKVSTRPISPTSARESANPMRIFHNALGIPDSKSPKPSRYWYGKKKPVKEVPQTQLPRLNNGVYMKVQSCERWAHIRYVLCDSVVTMAMFLQIIVGASVTAFGAGSANHIIITVFGAANTALASLLAVLKSQGLPNRLRQDWNGWRDLREFIEEKERELEMVFGGTVPVDDKNKVVDIWADIKLIEAKYSAMKLTSEANRPDSYTPVFASSLPK